MLQENIQMTYFIDQVKTIARSMVVKREKVAAIYETDLEAIKRADKYINTIENGDLWDSYVTFDSDVLISAGLDKSLISWFMSDKNNIPRQLRNKVVQLQKEKIINNYEEENDYYRMLAGQPPMSDTQADWIYVPENNQDIPTNIPVHKLGPEYIGFLRASGILDSIKAKYPNKGYLNYLGDKAISYYNSRTANNYDILYIDISKIESNVYTDFRTFYERARSYYMIGLYNKEYSNMFVWYDEFMGFSILVMAIQRLISNIFKQGLTRDFYDVELIKYLFKSYSIPYIEGMDLKYQRNLAKNLNLLLQYKSTDKVLYDVAKLLGYHNINIYKYYLIKNQKVDYQGRPIFIYESEVLPDGTEVKTPVYSAMYNFHFQRINLQEKDINTALTDTHNRMDYFTITMEDPYWVSDDELMKKLYEANYNNILTKYMSLDVIFKIVEMMYEVAHTLRMIIDNQKDFKLITIDIPKLSSNPVSLFDLIIFLCTLGAAKLNLRGSVPLKGYQIPSVYGFNYKANLPKLIEEIYNNEGVYTKIDPGLVKYITNMRATNVDDVDRLFTNITAFRKIITEYLFTTKDKETYYQYKKLYKALLLVEDVQELYKDNDGMVKETYESLLEEINPELHQLYLNIRDSGEGYDDYIDAIFVKISTLSIEYVYMQSINRNDIMFEFILKLIRFFKSYTVDFVNSGIQYFLDDRYLMGLKLLEVYNLGVDMNIDESIFKNGNWYKDFINNLSVGFGWKDDLTIKDCERVQSIMEQYESLTFYDRLLSIHNSILEKGELMTVDDIQFDEEMVLKDKPTKPFLKDSLYIDFAFINKFFDEKLSLKDNLILPDVSQEVEERMNLEEEIHFGKEMDIHDRGRKGKFMNDRIYIEIEEDEEDIAE